MKAGGRDTLAAAARVFGPFLVLLALMGLVASAPGAGIGFGAGLVLSLSALLHALVFGAVSARRAAPPALLRAALALGGLLALAGWVPPLSVVAPATSEAGLFLVTGAGAILAMNTLIGRASALDETPW